MGKKSKRSYGVGSYTVDKRNGKIIYRIIVDGRRLSVSGTSKSECRELMDKKREAIRAAEQVERAPTDQDSTAPLQDCIKDWLYNYKQHQLKGRSWDTIESTYNNDLKDTPLGLTPFCDVSNRQIQAHINQMLKAGKSTSTQKKTLSLLRQYCDYCRANGNTTILMVPGTVTCPRSVSTDEIGEHILTDAEMTKLTDILCEPVRPGISGSIHGPALAFLMWSFLRIGELIALDWSDISGNVVSVTKNAQEIRNRDKDGALLPGSHTVIYTPKSRAGRRSVSLCPQAVAALDICRKRAGKQEGPFVCTKNGGRVSQQYLNRTLQKALERAGIKKDLSPHDLRHSGISYQIRHKMDIKVISRLAGHSDVSVTMRIYYDLIPEQLDNPYS